MRKMTAEEQLIKFQKRIKVLPSGCWVYHGALDKDGYGKVTIGGKNWRAHRLSYALFHKKIDPEALICHKCDNPPCVNPYHLYAGTTTTNNRDTVLRGRYKNSFGERTHCSHGHPFSGDNLYENVEKRVCKICRRLWDKARYYRNKLKQNKK